MKVVNAWRVLFPVVLLALSGSGRAVTAPAAVTVRFAFQDWWVNRTTPNTVTLVTPWGRTVARPGGPGRPEAPTYHLALRPLVLRVPAGLRPGRHASTLHAQLYVCQAQQQVCARRELTQALTLEVLPDGGVRPVTVTLGDRQLRGGWR